MHNLIYFKYAKYFFPDNPAGLNSDNVFRVVTYVITTNNVLLDGKKHLKNKESQCIKTKSVIKRKDKIGT